MIRKFIFLFSVMVFVLLGSCGHRQDSSVPDLDKVESHLIEKPQQTFELLNHIKKNIDGQPETTRMRYQILLFRAGDLLNIPHGSDSMMVQVAKYYEAEQDSEHLAEANYCLGRIYQDLNLYKRSLECFHKALDCVDKRKYELIGRINNEIAQIEYNSYSYQCALQAFQKALLCFQKCDDKKSIPNVYLNLGKTYQYLNRIGECYICQEKAYQCAKALHSQKALLNVYLEKIALCFRCNDYQRADSIYRKAEKELDGKMYRDYYGMVYMKSIIAEHRGNYDLARKGVLSVLNQGNEKNRSVFYRDLSDIYKNGFRDYRTALLYADSANSLIDTIRTQANDKEIRNMQYMYNYEKKEKENTILKVENLETRQKLFVLTILLLLILICGLFYIIKYRKRQQRVNKTMLEAKLMNEKSMEQIRVNALKIERLKDMNDELSMLKLETLNRHNEKINSEIKNRAEIWKVFRHSEAYTY